ncbi:MAG TPA: type IV toxin-antitoxin system AbiEi family antitoxin domain-containing protein [Jiangellaceae bacterium]
MPAPVTRLPELVLRLLAAGRGVFMAAEAASVGVSEKRLQHLVCVGLLVRVAVPDEISFGGFVCGAAR